MQNCGEWIPVCSGTFCSKLHALRGGGLDHERRDMNENRAPTSADMHRGVHSRHMPDFPAHRVTSVDYAGGSMLLTAMSGAFRP